MIQRFWLNKRICRYIKDYKFVKKSFITKRNLSIFIKLFLFAKLSGKNLIKNYINNLYSSLSMYKNKDFKLLRLFLIDWKNRTIKLKLKNAINLIIDLMRKNSKISGKKIFFFNEKIKTIAINKIQNHKDKIINYFSEFKKRIEIIRNPKIKQIAYNATAIFLTMQNKTEFTHKNIIKVQRKIRRNKIKKLNLMKNLSKIQMIINSFKKLLKRLSFERIKSR